MSWPGTEATPATNAHNRPLTFPSLLLPSPPHHKLHRVAVGEIKIRVYLGRQLEAQGVLGTGEGLTAGQLHLGPHNAAIGPNGAFVVRDEQVNVVEDVRGSFLFKVLLKQRREGGEGGEGGGGGG